MIQPVHFFTSKVRGVSLSKADVCCVLVVAAFTALKLFEPSLAVAEYDESAFGVICNKSLGYLDGGFGALLAAVSGIGAIVASAMGGFRMAWGLLIVSVGAFILRGYLGLFGGDAGCS